jgi:hypothetical protein
MATKKYDLAVKTGTYISNGQEKGRYENIGSVFQGDNGPFLVLKRTFNPAGVPNPDDKDSVIVSCFEPRQYDRAQDQSQAPQNQGYPPPPPNNQPMGVQQGPTDNGFDSDIPF